MGGSNSGFASGWSGNTRSRGNSISQAEWLADPQGQNSYAYARRKKILRESVNANSVDLDSIIFDDDALRKMAKHFLS